MPEMSNVDQGPKGVSAHVDDFGKISLPPLDQWPDMDWKSVPELAAYPGQMNCAVELLDKQTKKYGDRPVIHFEDATWTYNDLLAKANQIAHVLVDDLGIMPGNRVFMRAPNNPMYVAIWLAVMKVGAIGVATMPLLRAKELTYITEKAVVKVGFCCDHLKDEMEKTIAQSTTFENAIYFSNLGQKPGNGNLDELMAGKPTTFDNIDTAADDVCLIAFTSGTTGPAKGCMHFHRDILAICDTFSRYVLKPTPEDIFCGSPPVAFTFGLGALVTFAMHAGSSTALCEGPAPEALMGIIEKHKATICFTAPTAFRVMTDLVDKYDISSLTKSVSAGETLPLPTYEGWKKATGIKTIDGIGSTEMLHIFIAAAEDDIVPGATGVPIPGFQGMVIDDDGNEVADGEVGRLAVKGPTGCRYLDNAERQAAYVQNGWNVTGDTYMKDAEGNFWFQARNDDMIISAGYNISGPEVEACLLEHPKVAECGVVAAPDPERGHIVKAYVMLREPSEAGPALAKTLQDYVKAQIAPYKYPRAIEFMTDMPRTETGKLQRFRLREMAAAASR
jgi:2-aminobenzoate-CoA ligase